jgi:hypothetical protein
MLKKFLVGITALLPMLAFAEPNYHANYHAFEHAAPEIDGGVTLLGLAILGGVLAFIKRKAK